MDHVCITLLKVLFPTIKLVLAQKLSKGSDQKEILQFSLPFKQTLIQSDKMPSFLLHTGGGNLPDTGQKTGGRHFNLPDSDQNMFSQTEKVELLKTNNEKSFNSNLIFLPTSAGTTQSAPRTKLGSGFRVPVGDHQNLDC